MSNKERGSLHYPLKALAGLLGYPDEGVTGHVDDLADVLVVRPELERADRAELEAFVAWVRGNDLLDVQAVYVETFDRSKKVSLYLFEHVYGESRDRGPAMVELTNAYREQGLEIDCRELPDFLPLFLEFCAVLPEARAREWLDEIGQIVQQVHVRLVERDSRYAVPFRVLLRLLEIEPMPEALVETASKEERDDTREALDRTWMEAPVTFGPDEPRTSCGATKQWQERPVQWMDYRNASGRSA
ncbi:MAG: nitrate reductase molybdenum cofactor assembly chaperone [Halofilum sp. (in: g-proteobacteria)]|nr:nitrate reductase molybdenum cofactor assembly chaperone [Halofilum sp. (in: g-proteobacteria)]